MAETMRKTLSNLVDIFIDRNTQYAGPDHWAGNFLRNAELNRVLRIKEIIEKPYGRPLQFVVDKVDRAINGIIDLQNDKEAGHLADSIDDAIVYLFITKMLLKEAGYIEDDEVKPWDGKFSKGLIRDSLFKTSRERKHKK
jgi:hypothetical protein